MTTKRAIAALALGVAGLTATAVPTAAQTSAPAEADAEADRPHRHIRLECRARITDHGPVVGCRWPVVTADPAAGYVLYRKVDDGDRRPVFATRNLEENHYRERVRPGHVYTYWLTVVNARGHVIAHSGPEVVRVPAL